MKIAATRTVQKNCVKRALLKYVKEMKKLERGSSDVFTKNNSSITFFKWKDSIVVTVAFTLYGQSFVKKAKSYIKEKHGRLDIEQPQSIY